MANAIHKELMRYRLTWNEHKIFSQLCWQSKSAVYKSSFVAYINIQYILYEGKKIYNIFSVI